MRSAERRKVNVLEKCLRRFVTVSRMDRVRNEEVRRRVGIENELASRADPRALRWPIYLTSVPWCSVVAPFLQFIPTASHTSPGDNHQSTDGRSERTQSQAKMAA